MSTTNHSPKVTIYDLAKELNTSASTVSRALQDHPRISKKMKEAVRRLAEERGFHPDPVAHQLRTGKSQLIAIVVSDLKDFGMTGLVSELERILRDSHYKAVVVQVRDIEDPSSLSRMLIKKMDGVIFLGDSLSYVASSMDKFRSLDVPMVFGGFGSPNEGLDKVLLDGYRLGEQLAGYLNEKRTRKICYYGNPGAGVFNEHIVNGISAGMKDTVDAVIHDMYRVNNLPHKVSPENGGRHDAIITFSEGALWRMAADISLQGLKSDVPLLVALDCPESGHPVFSDLKRIQIPYRAIAEKIFTLLSGRIGKAMADDTYRDIYITTEI